MNPNRKEPTVTLRNILNGAASLALIALFGYVAAYLLLTFQNHPPAQQTAALVIAAGCILGVLATPAIFYWGRD